MAKLHSFSNKYRNNLIIVSCVIILIVGISSIFIEISIFKFESELLREKLIQEKKFHVKSQVNSAMLAISSLQEDLEFNIKTNIKKRVYEAYSICENLYNEYKDKKTKNEIVKIIKDALRPIRFFDERGYYFLISTNGIGVLNPNHSYLEGKNILKYNYYNGKYPILEIFNVLKGKEESYVSYSWKNTNLNGTDHFKTTYVKKLPFYNLVLGCGDYLDYVEDVLKEKAIKKLKSIRYDEDGYIFVTKFDGTAVIIESSLYKKGDDLTRIVDSDGINVFDAEIKQAIKPLGGYLYYKGLDPNNDRYQRNLSYVSSIPKWEWIVGGFTDVSKIDTLIKESKENLYSNMFERVIYVFGILSIVLFFVILLSNKTKKRLDLILNIYFKELKMAFHDSSKNIDIDLYPVIEYKQLAEATNVLLELEREVFDKLELRNSLLQTLIDTIPVVIFYKTTDGIYRGCNEAYSDFVNISKDDIIGKSVFEMFNEKDADVFKTKDDELFEDKGTQIYENEVTNGKGEKRHVLFYKAVYYNAEKQVEGLVGAMIDTTDRVKMEIELRNLNKTKDRFFSIIAHDLKNPFNSLLGLLEILTSKYDELDDETRKQYIEVLSKTSNNLFDLLLNLLEWSRSQTSSIKYNPEYLNLNELIDNELNILRGQAINKDIVLGKQRYDSVFIMADKYMMSTVIRNFISNSIKFTNPKGEIIVSVKREGKYVNIYVKDNGVGMSKEKISKLFALEEKVSTVGTSNEVGTGLGLLLCKEFIEKHGGEIIINSEEGKGSVFCVKIPNME